MSELEKLNLENLEEVSGGAGSSGLKWINVKCKVQTGYLALRTFPEYNDGNIIARINNGTKFKVTYDQKAGDYVWASYGGMTGWVNKNYTVKI